MLAEVKTALRISHNALDTELNDLIEAARHDLKLSGVSANKADEEISVDPLIKRSIIVYCKANFGLENKDSDKYQDSYLSLKKHLSMSVDYNV
jgi:uncharacterized phage protein (predicted DNA packaging)